jgi:hypothetical protein
MPATFYIATTPLSGHTAYRRFSRTRINRARVTSRGVV